jgi:hypothetical protein
MYLAPLSGLPCDLQYIRAIRNPEVLPKLLLPDQRRAQELDMNRLHPSHKPVLQALGEVLEVGTDASACRLGDRAQEGEARAALEVEGDDVQATEEGEVRAIEQVGEGEGELVLEGGVEGERLEGLRVKSDL